jgi:omega-6 fatty acid desaturase (delta-12 desaturase)
MLDAPREGKALIDASREFAVEDRAKSWFHFVSTFALLGGSMAIAAHTPQGPNLTLGWIGRVMASLLASLLMIRAFILYHDHLHGALLRSSPVARVVFWIYGLYMITPPPVWRETHNYHHANTAKIVGSHVGSYMMVTTGMWADMTPRQRAFYKIMRHPTTIVFAYLTLFMYGMGISSFLRAKKKHLASLAAVLLNWALTGVLVWKFGFATFAFVMLIPLAASMTIGGYLFYAQHNFPDVVIHKRDKWSYTRAAIDSSSYMEMGPLMRFFCGNIGFHHVHHLNSMIPFYRLPEAMQSIPELRDPPKTSLAPAEIAACFRLKLWDPELQRMVGYPEDALEQPARDATN